MFTKDLLLLGGGHTHVLLIKALAMRPILGVRVTLVSEQLLTPYSGMLPGFVAGHYSLAQTNIDLNQLCRRAGVRWVQARCDGIDPDRKRAYLVDQADMEFDVLSIDIGSTPDQRISGASEFAVGVKPIAGFQRRWNSLLQTLGSPQINQQLSEYAVEKIDWGVIGAGAGGVELVLAMAHRLRDQRNLQFHLIYRGKSILPGYPKTVVSQVEQSLKDSKVILHAGFSVAEVTHTGVISDTGEHLSLDERIWCTGAVGAAWLNAGALLQTELAQTELAHTELAHTDKNFIQVRRTLQSTSHDSVFAVGDIAEMVDDPRPKAGVFAVRQAPYLEQNLRRLFAGERLQDTKLQKHFLSLLAMGGQVAVASRNGLAVKGQWVWRWKDSIDRKFMRQFSELPMSMSMPTTMSERPATDSSIPSLSKKGQQTAAMHCGGCGSKLGPELLAVNLAKVSPGGSHEIEDAALWKPTPGTLAVQSMDGFRSFMSDESRFARICVNHALSDIYAMGATAIHIQAWINLAFSSPNLAQRDHLRMLRGIQAGLSGSRATLSGGHSSEGAESHLGIVANGEVVPGAQWTKSGAQPGDLILLSKALGTGIVMAADMQGRANAGAVQACYESMLLSNHRAMQLLHQVNPSAVTDVTGFGLIGHLLEMLDSGDKTLVAQLDLTAIPLLTGALKLAEAGWRSSLYPQLEPYLLRCMFADQKETVNTKYQRRPALELLLDPQTNGGLLVTINQSNAAVLLEDKNDFIVIGKIKDKASTMPDGISINIVT